jgi:hypothetical protein
MNKSPIRLTISLLLSVLLVLPSIAIAAGRGHGGGGGGRGGAVGRPGFGGHPGFGHHGRGGVGFGGRSHGGFGHHGRPFHRDRFGRAVVFGAFASPLTSYGWPGAYGWPYFWGTALGGSAYYYGAPYGYGALYGVPAAYSQPAYSQAPAAPTVYSINVYSPPPVAQPVAQPVIFEPPPAPASPAAAARPQDVVEYEGGRYELRGDGIAVPYRWVWIPNPPAGPPGSAALRAPVAGDLAPARRGTIYHWLDDDGVLHVTDRWQAVPQRYREQAKQNLAS